MSPVATDMLTCMTSVEVKIAYKCMGVTDSSAGESHELWGCTWYGRTRESFILLFASAYP
jgi:hypothetical protein